MRAVFIFILFVVLAFLIGAIAAYPLKLLLDPVFSLVFRKYLNYATLITGLIISGIYLHLYKLLSFSAFGYSGGSKTFFKGIVNGFVYGILIIAIIETVLLLLGIHEADTTRSFSINSLLVVVIKGLLAGLLIGLVEESIFRGALFTGLYKQTGAIISVFCSSLTYSTVHFIRYQDLPADTDIGWLTGLTMMPEAFRRFFDWSIEDYFLTLFVFGMLLCLLRLKHKSIAACIGVHAGVVTLTKITDYVTNRTHNSDYEYLVSQYNSTFGWMSFVVILLFTGFYLTRLKTGTVKN